MNPVPNVLSVDVEDYFQVSAFEDYFPRERWDGVASRIDIGVRRILELTAEANVRGTFFVLGWLARRRPDLVREIASQGHEIGCHGYEHRLIYSMTPESFRADLRMALDVIAHVVGSACAAFRAPSFSITRESLWALPILAEEGVRVDSSIYPIRHDRYGLAGAPRGPFRPLRRVPGFVEFPPATVRLFGATLPCAGGGYLRLLPLAVTRAAIRRIHSADRRPVLVYVHPWELDPEQPVVPVGFARRFRHRIAIRRMAGRLRKLLSEFRFAPITHVVEAVGGASMIPFSDLGNGVSGRSRA